MSPLRTLASVAGYACAAVAVLLIVFCSTGCGAIDSGPKMMKETSAGVMAVTSTLASQMSPTNLTASARGSVTNPEYQCTGFVGTGVKWDVTIRLIGANLGFDIAAAGEGKLEPDEKIFTFIENIQDRRDISPDEKRGLIEEAVASWLLSRATGREPNSVGGTDAPVGGSSSSSIDRE